MYDPATMELEKGERPSEANQEVPFVTSPGMKQRRGSTSDGFEVENLLVRSEVFCKPVT